jgi:nucleoid-associated protein YgaU
LTAVAAATGIGCVAALLEGAARLDAAMAAAVPDPAFVSVAQILAATSGCWLAVGTLCTLLGEVRWRGRTAARLGARLLPGGWRTALLAAVGTSLLSGPAVAAGSGAMPAGHDIGHPSASAVAVLHGLPLPDRASGVWHRPHRSVTVRAGDSLWALSASALPAHTNPGAIAGRCWRWYDANADVIGDDPDLLLPGTRLQAPAVAGHLPAG